jgi:hypothetical protein
VLSGLSTGTQPPPSFFFVKFKEHSQITGTL